MYLMIPAAFAIELLDTSGIIFYDETYSYEVNTTLTNISTITLTSDFKLDGVTWCSSIHKPFFTTTNQCLTDFTLNVTGCEIEWCKLLWV